MRNWLNFITHEKCKRQARIKEAMACQKVMEVESKNEILIEAFHKRQIDSYAQKIRKLEMDLQIAKAATPPKP